jgi:hypothetical protein
LLVLAMSWSTAAAQAGAGLEPGVHIDPGSPAAKEYVLPLNQARQIGGGTPSSRSPSGALFGAGITPPGAGGSSHLGAGSGNARPKSPATAHGPGGAIPAGTQSTLPAGLLRDSSSQAGPTGSGDSILALLAGGVAILAIGGLGGMVLRRSHHPIT